MRYMAAGKLNTSCHVQVQKAMVEDCLLNNDDLVIYVADKAMTIPAMDLAKKQLAEKDGYTEFWWYPDEEKPPEKDELF